MSGVQPVSVTAGDNVGVSNGAIMIDGTIVASFSGKAATYNWNTSQSKAGGHKLQSKVQDTAGNVGMSAPVPLPSRYQQRHDVAERNDHLSDQRHTRRPRRPDVDHGKCYRQCRRRTRENVRRRLGHLRAEDCPLLLLLLPVDPRQPRQDQHSGAGARLCWQRCGGFRERISTLDDGAIIFRLRAKRPGG